MGPITIKPDKKQSLVWMSELFFYYSFFMGLCAIPLVLNWGDQTSFYILAAAFSVFFTSLLIRIPLYHQSLKYCVDDDLLKLERGYFWKEEITIPYSKITSMDVIQGPIERLFNLCQIHLQTASSGGLQSNEAQMRLTGIRHKEEVKKMILDKIQESSGLASSKSA
jgi:membrane protein YdbS with pleckstrin-like domain